MRSTLVVLCLALGSSSALAAETPEQVHLFPRSTYAWPFPSGPVYHEVEAERWSEPGVLHTRVGSFDLKRGSPALPAELRAGPGSPYAILQVDPASYADGRFDRIRALLEQRGGVLLEAMAVSAHVVRVSPGLNGILRAQDGVLALEPYHPAFKLAPNIGRVPLSDPARAISEVYRLEAVVFRGESAEAVATKLERLGASIARVDPDVVFFEVARDRLADVARIDAVKAIHETLPNLPHGEETTVTVQTGTWGQGAAPYHDAGVRGEGQILMVLDSGLQLDAADLSDTRTSAGTPGPSHRKVLLYTTAVGGAGDALGCDASPQGGFTHGHVVAATALGNATDVAAGYGASWWAADTLGGQWKLDGVAPRAKLLMYDAQVTPSTLSCTDPEKGGLSVGTLYLDGVAGSGSMGDAYTRGARVFNFSWGTTGNNIYGTNAQRADQFLFDQPDAMVFVSAGNAGTDSQDDHVPDPLTISDPATCKSCIVVGASGNVDEPHREVSHRPTDEGDRAPFSGVGPVGATSRIAPLLMAPGTDFGDPGASMTPVPDFGDPGPNMGVDSAYACRTSDNDQSDPVECDLVQSLSSTSFATAAAAGAGLLVRDWFQQGFYPDGTSADPGNAADQVPDISGALLKAVLVTSAQWMQGGDNVGGNTSLAYRFNREQGYGRIQLSNALPLSTYAPSPSGMIVSDGGIAGGRVDLAGIPGSVAAAGTTQTGTLRVEDGTRELRCALAWTEDGGDALAHDLDLEMVSPSGKIYFGNFFSEDVDGDGVLDAGENCHDRGLPNTLDREIWSIETHTCGVLAGTRRDTRNPVEAVFLSPTVGQVEVGDWSVRVIYRTGSGSQSYALSCSGPIATGSAARFERPSYACADPVRVTVVEASDPQDPGITAAEVGSRTTVQVVDVQGVVRDTETGLSFTASSLRFDSGPLYGTDSTAYDPGNGVLDVRHGDRLRVLYADETSGVPDPAKLATGEARVDCRVHVALGGVVWATWGKDASTLVKGGCERDARNLFTFGFPDKFMDAGELINYRVAFESSETVELRDFQATLRCVHADLDSPAGCLPGSMACPDPDRTNNPPCTEMTVLDSPQPIGTVPPGRAVSVNFNIQMTAAITGTPKVDMLLGITARQAGRTVEKLIASRHVLDVDELSTFYSTDFPTGGTEIRDFNGNETVENPTTDAADAAKDYLFETRTYGDLTAGGTKNIGLQAPWNFDDDDEGFRVGLNPATNGLGGQIVANWGEDTNFNNVLDPGEDRDPINGALDNNWSTLGGCGWQTKGANPTGGVWHTGGIGLTTGTCGTQCELVDTLANPSVNEGEWETLVTPVVEKIHTGLDADGDPTHRLELTNWAWNTEMDLKDGSFLLWELDTDTRSATRADLFRDQEVLNFIDGGQGALSGGNAPLTGGFPVFAPFQGTTSVNGTAGSNRVGKNACLFEAGPRQADSTLKFARPADDDLDNDGDLLVDEYVTANGPIRNFDLNAVNGLDLRFNTLDDVYGDAGNSFQGALGFWVTRPFINSPPQPGYGVAVDDMVIEWREVALVKDATGCAGACATLSFDVTNGYEGIGVLGVTVLDASPWDPAHPVNDCNGDNDYTDPGDDQDCDDDGTQDVTVKASATGDPGKSVLFALDRTAPGSPQWKGSIPYSVGAAPAGTLHVGPNFVSYPPYRLPNWSPEATVTVRYDDRDDGAGQRCQNDANAALQGILEESTDLLLPAAIHVSVAGARLQDNGDHDGFADPNETVTVFLTLHNNSGVDLSGLVLRLSSNSLSVDCILDPVVYFGSLGPHQTKESPEAFTFHVANVARGSVEEDLSTSLNVFISGDTFDLAARAQTVAVDLDLNVSGGVLPGTYTEGFEGAGFGTFTTMSLDAGRESLAQSDGYRCQYNDPNFVNSNSYGNTFCYLGAAVPADNGYDWHVHGLASPDGGRAYLGNNSMHWGVHPGAAASSDTTRLKQLDAIRSNVPINLGWNGVTSELSFKHQIGLTDSDYVGLPDGYAVDRGIVQVQLASSTGLAVGNWRKISPYENLYDKQAEDNYSNCIFDPVDDGSTEDDYFDPADPERRLGPSSTCFPEFVFARQGAIYYTDSFDPADIHHASEGPGLQGSRGPGTWVQTKFDLSRYRGRRVRLRFLTTSIEVSNALTMQQALAWNPIEADDGWYIDDIKVTNTTTGVSTVTVDTADRTGLPGCGPVCTSITPDLAASPPATAAPGQLTLLSAASSFADRCTDGLLQFRFWEDRNGNGVVGDAGDLLLRTWSEDPTLLQAPSASTRYGVEVRCSSLATCMEAASVLVSVPCPSTGNARAPFDQTVSFASKTQLAWPAAEQVDVIRGDLGALRSSGGQFNGTVEVCLTDSQNVSSVADATTPGPGAARYYLVRGAGPSAYCNATPSWKTGVAAENPGAGGDRDVDLALDPDACP